MKKLRMTLATSMLLFLTAIVLQSCLDDWDDKYDTLFAVGCRRLRHNSIA